MSYIIKINRAIDFIEANLTKPLATKEIALEAGMSRWHFQRMFRAFVGDAVVEYVRCRRLSLAAKMLTETDDRIIDIAMACEFTSNEVFSRAFKRTFGASPQAFRKNGPALIPQKPKVTMAYLNHLYKGMTMEPKIIRMEAITVIGLQAHFSPSPSPKADNLQVIPALWQKFRARAGDFPPGERIGVVLSPTTTEDRLQYLAGVITDQWTETPKGATQLNIPPSTYAVFTHKGPMANINHTMNYIFGSWLPKSGHDLADSPEFALYDKNFHPQSEGAKVYIHIPLKKA